MASSLVLLATQARALDELLPCRRQNAQLWFSDLPAELQLAKAYCQPCPLRRVCLAGAVERHEPHGVWGGEIFAGGEIITEKRPPGRPPRAAARAQSELTARRFALAHQAELPCEDDDLGAVGRAEGAQSQAMMQLAFLMTTGSHSQGCLGEQTLAWTSTGSPGSASTLPRRSRRARSRAREWARSPS